MRFRKSAIILLAAVMLFAAAFIYFDARLLEKLRQTSQTQDGSQSEELIVVDGSNQALDSTGQDGAEQDADISDEELVSFENVKVDFNTPEYDIEAALCENAGKKTFLRLQYYTDGVSSVYELDEDQIPELKNIFENREKEAKGNAEMQSGNPAAGAGKKQDEPDAAAPPYSIGQALLNPVHGQLYILINGAPLDGYTQSALYIINLYDISIKKLFSYPAKYGKMSFSSDFSLLAYDFEDPKLMSMYPEDSLFDVYSCTKEEFLVRGSRRPDHSPIGPDGDPGYIYDYTFRGWAAPDTVKLTRASHQINGTDAGPVISEVIYNVTTDSMLNADGSEISTANEENGNTQGSGGDGMNGNVGENGTEAGDKHVDNPGGKPESGTAAEGSIREPVEQLKSFYSYLGSENDYDKAMQLLDDGFVLRLGLLKQFGIDEIRKSDINAGYNQNNVSMYAGLLKAAKFEGLVSAEISKDGTAVIKYYQTLGLTADSQVSQLMSAILEKKDKVWIIKLIEDGIE